MHFLRPTLAALALAALTGVATAEQGITDTSVTFAQVAALDGPAAALGTGMRAGIEAAFAEANAAGGVQGRQVLLEAFDDGYEPDSSVARVKEVIAGNAHIGLIGPVGTPTASATQPLATAAGWPYIGPFTGAGFLRNAEFGNVFNVRASYDAETEDWIRYLVDVKGMSKIAILYQDDGFGRVGLAGVQAALERRGMALVAEGTYVRNTVAVKGALLDLAKSGAEAVVMVGAYKPIAEFIRYAAKIDFAPTFVNISFVGSRALADELGADGEGVIISQVVPFPWDDSVPLVADYLAAMQAAKPDTPPGFVSLEGYMVGRLALTALEAAGKDLTRESYLAALQGLTSVDLDGTALSFGPGDNQGMDQVFLTRIKADGSFEPITD